MSDLLAGSGGARAANGGATRAPGPVPVGQGAGSQQTTPARAQVTTPRDIMKRRQERKAQAEAEAARARLEGKRPSASTSEDVTSQAPQLLTPQSAQPSGSGTRRSVSNPTPGRPPDDSYQYPAYPNRQPQTVPGPSNAAASQPQTPGQPSEPGVQYRSRASSQSQGEPRPVTQQTQAGPSGTQRGPQAAPQPPQPIPAGASQPRPGQSVPAGSSSARPLGSESGHRPTASQATTSSFPHAFERWETLSSHWEGLTSYWIRKLEANTEELQRQPLMAQLSRQVTDLSAAGANLFHAVVELQRLRASSERKFQRWFFDSRKEQERQQELTAQLKDALAAERNSRATDFSRIQSDHDHAKRAERNALTLVAEIKRELQISKDEARRAWEELGRREQEERERTIALREGNPIVIGGIQVLPTVQGESSRRESVSQAAGAREGASHQSEQGYEGEPSPSNTDPFIEEGPPRHRLHHEPEGLRQDAYQRPYAAESAYARSDSTARTAVPASAPEVYQPTSGGASYRPEAPAGGSATSPQAISGVPTTVAVGGASIPAAGGGFYQHGGTFLHDTSQPQATDGQSYVGSAEETFSDNGDEYEMDQHGNIRLDAQGRPIRVQERRGLRSEGSDEYDVAGDIEHENILREQYGRSGVQYPAIPALSSSAAQRGGQRAPGTAAAEPSASRTAAPPSSQATASSAPDYSGSAYGSWDTRHHHLSRLSDVTEEDEMSRVSELSHGVRSAAESGVSSTSAAPF